MGGMACSPCSHITQRGAFGGMGVLLVGVRCLYLLMSGR